MYILKNSLSYKYKMGGEEDIQRPVDAASAAQVEPEVVAEAATPAAGVVVEQSAPVQAPSAAGSQLSEAQKKAITSLLGQTTDFAKTLVQDGSMGALSMTKLIGNLMKNAESLQVDGTKLKGAEKKDVVLEVGKQLLTTIIPEERRATVVELYNALAEPTLEAMIDMSRGVNFATVAMNIVQDKEVQVVVGKAARSCVSFCC
jgi:hypothetical protein